MADFDRSAFITKFQEEATDLLQRLNEGFIRWSPSRPTRANRLSAARRAHTQGLVSHGGPHPISEIAHRMEDIMVRIRDGQLAYKPEMSDAIFEALDTVRYLAEHAADEEPAGGTAAGTRRRRQRGSHRSRRSTCRRCSSAFGCGGVWRDSGRDASVGPVRDAGVEMSRQ